MLIQTNELDSAKLRALGEPEVHQLYCGLDCCVTFEVFEELASLLTPANAAEPVFPVCYSFERALQAPALDMMLRGFKIDQYARYEGIERTKGELAIIRGQLDELATCIWGKGLNANSPKQLKDFFFGAMRMPEVVIREHGEKRVSTNREALERLHADGGKARPKPLDWNGRGLRVTFILTHLCDAGAACPGVRRLDGRTLEIPAAQGGDFADVYRTFVAVAALACA